VHAKLKLHSLYLSTVTDLSMLKFPKRKLRKLYRIKNEKLKKKDVENSIMKALKLNPIYHIYYLCDEVTENEMLFRRYQVIWTLE
jgi:hypothetical protein